MFCCALVCVTTGILGVLLLLIINYWWKVRGNHYWKERNVPSDAPVPFVGNYLGMFSKGTTFFDEDQGRYKKFGRVFGGYEGFMPILFVGEPELLRSIMVKDFHCFANRRDFSANDEIFRIMVAQLRDEQWRRVRSVVTPAFSTGKLKKMLPLLHDCVKASEKNFLKAADSGENVDTKRMFGMVALDIIASVAFGTKLDCANDPENPFVQNSYKIMNTDYPWRLIFINMMPNVARWLGLKPFDPNTTKFFLDFSKEVIAKRRQQNTSRQDFLQLLMEAQKRSKDGQINLTDEDKPTPQENGEEFSLSLFEQYIENKTITENEFVAQCVQFFQAGFEGVSTTLAMVTYFMALNPECQEKLLQEVDELIQKYGDLGYEAVSEAKYLDCILSETLRMAPPGVRLSREANEDYKLGDTGITIPKGMNVVFPVYAMHYDPDFFPNPEKFDPDRFSPENKDQIRPFSYLPFGAGPRHCIGMRLAQMEIKLCLLNLFRKFTFAPCGETDIPPKIFKGAFQYQPRTISLKVLKRNVK